MSEKERNVIVNDDVLDLPSLETVSFGGGSFKKCHDAVFESM